MREDIELQKSQSAALPQVSGGQLIELAINQNLDIEKLKALVELQREFQRDEERRALNMALAKFQGECPAIPKNREAKFKTKSGGEFVYKYASIDDIYAAVRPVLQENGLSINHVVEMKRENNVDYQVVRCVLRHELGGETSSTFVTQVDRKDVLSSSQNSAVALTYAKRYSLCNVLGIAATDNDNDGGMVEVVREKNEAKSDLLIVFSSMIDEASDPIQFEKISAKVENIRDEEIKTKVRAKFRARMGETHISWDKKTQKFIVSNNGSQQKNSQYYRDQADKCHTKKEVMTLIRDLEKNNSITGDEETEAHSYLSAIMEELPETAE